MKIRDLNPFVPTDEANVESPYDEGARFQVDQLRRREARLDAIEAARERREENHNDPSQRLVDGISNIVGGGIFRQIDNSIPVSWPSFDVVEAATFDFVATKLQNGFNHTVDTVMGRNKEVASNEAASSDADVNSKLPRKPKSKDRSLT